VKKIKGLYYYQDTDYFSLIRFYEDLTVIGVNSSISFAQVYTVLTWSRKRFREGVYKITDDNRIFFDLKSDIGVVEYRGRILDNNKIFFQSHSHINDYEHEETYTLYQKEYNLEIFETTFQEYFSTVISPVLKKKLENAFEYYVANIDNPYIISEIQYKEVDRTILLIAKDPKKETYHGILTGKFANEKVIVEIPVANITWGKFKEIPIDPFLVKPFIENGIRLKMKL